MAKPAKIIKCQHCKAVVGHSALGMFEHILMTHPGELLRAPGRLVGMARDPATQRALATELFNTTVRKLTGLK